MHAERVQKKRRSIRLQGYDYSLDGAYFVTIVTNKRQCLFGSIVNSTMGISEAGQIAIQNWFAIPAHFPHVQLDEFIVMPNHIHGILVITNDVSMNAEYKNKHSYAEISDTTVGAKNFSPLQTYGTSKTIGSIIRGFKIGVTKWFRHNHWMEPIWQRNYFEHIIRNENSLELIRDYIRKNPYSWESDPENPHI